MNNWKALNALKSKVSELVKDIWGKYNTDDDQKYIYANLNIL